MKELQLPVHWQTTPPGGKHLLIYCLGCTHSLVVFDARSAVKQVKTAGHQQFHGFCQENELRTGWILSRVEPITASHD
jgi:hypothetical protein